MKDIELMKAPETKKYLNKNIPYLFFIEKLFLFFVLNNLLIEIAVIEKLHDDAE